MKTKWIFFPIAIMLVNAGCAGHSGIISIESFEGFSRDSMPPEPVYRDSWEAMQHFNLDITGNNQRFAQGLDHIINGNICAAESVMHVLFLDSSDTVTQMHAQSVLREIYILRSQWDSLIRLSSTPHADLNEQNTLKLIRAYNTAEKESIYFMGDSIALPMALNSSSQPLIEVKVNGVRKKFLVDTGASFTVIASDIAERARVLPIDESEASAATSTSVQVGIRPAVITSLKIGDLEIRNHPVLIIDKKDLEFKLLGLFRILKIDGVIGWNAIQNLDLTLDYKNKKALICKPVECDSALGNRNLFWLGYPMLIGSDLYGRDILLNLDTGADRTDLFTPILSKIDTDGIQFMNIHVGGAGGREKQKIREIPSFSFVLDRHRIRMRKAVCRRGGFGTFFVADGIVGSDIAREGAIRLDFTNGRFKLIPGEE
jgi:predicted aspartyl protease